MMGGRGQVGSADRRLLGSQEDDMHSTFRRPRAEGDDQKMARRTGNVRARGALRCQRGRNRQPPRTLGELAAGPTQLGVTAAVGLIGTAALALPAAAAWLSPGPQTLPAGPHSIAPADGSAPPDATAFSPPAAADSGVILTGVKLNPDSVTVIVPPGIEQTVQLYPDSPNQIRVPVGTQVPDGGGGYVVMGRLWDQKAYSASFQALNIHFPT
jgi:hypothetical protein